MPSLTVSNYRKLNFTPCKLLFVILGLLVIVRPWVMIAGTGHDGTEQAGQTSSVSFEIVLKQAEKLQPDD